MDTLDIRNTKESLNDNYDECEDSIIESNTNYLESTTETTTDLDSPMDFSGKISDFSFLEEEYSFFNEGGKLTYDKVAEKMVEDFLVSLFDENEDFSFQILEYNNLHISFYQMSDGYGYIEYKPNENDSILYFSAYVSLRYKGFISPLNYSPIGTEDFYVINLYDWVLIRDQFNYKLYPSGYYFKLFPVVD
ncbi:hypothetical protein QE109_14090 [Fusibacter bizertensis]|uniref:DUF5348 domain-containing protein n=1 Tax=Fusibacter bizertensis TaxID=1488331 RepID=A0ABT6NFU8_9FIRM|nr:hypothetical protein [Fusibacter bizertensis]MDH8679284.1 hypothetical protein [Fusibacter bizertensis]